MELKELKGKFMSFFRTILKSLYPNSYNELSKRPYRQALAYILILVVFAMLASAIVAMPKLLKMPDYLKNQTAVFTRVNVDLDVEMTKPFVFTNDYPLLTIDTTGNITNISRGRLLVTGEKILYRQSLNKVKELNLTEFKELTRKKETVIRFGLAALLLILPALLAIIYVISVLKYMIIIVLATVTAYAASSVLKYGLRLKEILNMAVYSSTIMLLIEFLSWPLGIVRYTIPVVVLFNISIQLIGLAAFLVIFIIAFILVGTKEL